MAVTRDHYSVKFRTVFEEDNFEVDFRTHFDFLGFETEIGNFED